MSINNTIRLFLLTCGFVLLCLNLALSPAAAQETPAQARAHLGVNGFDWDFYFVDLMQNATFDGPHDMHGWPTGDVDILFYKNWYDARAFQQQHAPDNRGVYRLSFNCENPQVTVKPDQNDTTITDAHFDDKLKQWSGNVHVTQISAISIRFSDTHGGIRQVKMLRPGYEREPGSLLTHEILADLQPFGGPFRPISDQGYGTNPYPAMRDWATRPSPLAPVCNNSNNSSNPNWEWQIRMANAMQRDLWINIPINTDDNYVRNLARLCKDGGTVEGVRFPSLDEKLKLYVEYCNEVWNWGFYQTSWNWRKSYDELAAGNPDAPHGGSNMFRYVTRATRISDIFREVYGDAAMNTRIRPVLMWQQNARRNGALMAEFVERNFGFPAHYFYAVGDAPYIGAINHDNAPTLNTDQLLDGIKHDLVDNQPNYAPTVAMAKSYGLTYSCYEGETLFCSISGDLTDAYYRGIYDPRVDALTQTFYRDFLQAGGDIMCWTGLQGQAMKYGSWGIVEDALHPEGSPRWVGAKKISEQTITPTAGVVVTNDAPVTFNAGELASQCPSTHRKITNEGDKPFTEVWNPHPVDEEDIRSSCDFLLNVVKGGNYALTMLAAGPPNKHLQVCLDGQALADQLVPVADRGTWKTTSPIALTLTKGLHALSVISMADQVHANWFLSDLILTPDGLPPHASAPSAPLEVSPYPEKGRILLRWHAASQNGSPVMGYNIFRGATPEKLTLWKTKVEAWRRAVMDEQAKDGVTYYYQVSAINQVGESPRSAVVSAAPVLPPAPPQELTVEVKAGKIPQRRR